MPQPLSFERLWFPMGVRKRAIFFENVNQKTALSAESLNARLGEIQHGPTSILFHRLSYCSMEVFRNCIRVLSVGEATTVGGLTHSSNASNTTTAMTFEMKGKARRCCCKPTSKTYTHETKIPHRTCVSNISYFLPPPAYAAKPEDLQLRQLVHNLPEELFDKLLQDFLYMALGPRKLYADDERLYMRAFGALNRVMYAKHRRIFLSQSTWVIGQGNCQETTSFLNQMPMSMLRNIRKIEIKLSGHDCIHPSLDHYFAPPDISEPKIDRLIRLLYYMIECARFATELMRTWLGKFDAVKALQLKLDEVVFDVSDAYGLDGDYLGRHFTRSAILQLETRNFAGGAPVKISLLRPDSH